MENKTGTFLACCIDFFGLKDGQSRIAFLKDEIKPLTEQDREEIAEGLKQNGYTLVAA